MGGIHAAFQENEPHAHQAVAHVGGLRVPEQPLVLPETQAHADPVPEGLDLLHLAHVHALDGHRVVFLEASDQVAGPREVHPDEIPFQLRVHVDAPTAHEPEQTHREGGEVAHDP